MATLKASRRLAAWLTGFLAIAVSVAGRCETTAQAPASTDLGPLLDGVEDQCRYGDMLEHLWRALPDTAAARDQVAEPLRGAFGEITIVDEVDFRMYSIPVNGAWRGVPVRQIEFGLGNGNGIHVLLVEFNAPGGQAEAVFAPVVEQSKRAMAEDPNNNFEATTDLMVEDGRTRLICDLST